MKPTDPRNPLGYRFIAAHVDHQADECLIYPYACCTPGYGVFQYLKKKHLAHRFMCEQKHGPPPGPDFHAAHSCGNRRCVNPSHLSWKTQSDNQLDRRIHNTHNKTRRKLTQMQADQIRELRGIETSVQTSARYGVTESNVRQIQGGKTWGTDRVLQMWTPEEDNSIRDAIKKGFNFQKMSEYVGRSRSAVTGRVYRLGLKSGQARSPRRGAAGVPHW